MKLIVNLKIFLLSLISRTSLIVKLYSLDKSLYYVWGMKRSGYRLIKKINKSKLIYLEDGFIHSYGIKKSKIPLSICFDKSGIYYNYNSASRLFNLINSKLRKDNYLRARRIIKLWKEFSISKYNFPNFISPPSQKYILLIDQTFGDLSIYYGGANRDSFSKMFHFAIENWPDHKIVIKVHPDVIKSKKTGYLDKTYYYKENIIVISELGQINKLIEFSTAVCVVTSQVGFEALIYQKEVHTFGNTFYSGLGLTIDHGIAKERNKKQDTTLEQLVFGSLVRYQKYLDPRNKKICEIEKIIEFINSRRKIDKFFPNNLYCLNLTPWKARQIHRYTKDLTGIKVSAFRKYRQGMQNVLSWGKSIYSDNNLYKTKTSISVEDGFIRSVGLGADLFSPMSLVFDKKGIHYDYSKPSDLEDLLQNRVVNDEELYRANQLIQNIKIKNISKYNLKTERLLFQKKQSPKQKIIIVLGQVETDNSIVYGVPNNTIKKTNYSLVCKVREDYPNDYIIYKPHPDLENGLRAKGFEENHIKNIADLIAYKTSITELFEISNRVAVFTSLGGFEALIRNIPVTCYGWPFYSGWGLTEDKVSSKLINKRRTRKLSLGELVYMAIIEYPYYFSLKFNCITEVEDIIDEIYLNRNEKKSIEQIIFRYWGTYKDFLKRTIF